MFWLFLVVWIIFVVVCIVLTYIPIMLLSFYSMIPASIIARYADAMQLMTQIPFTLGELNEVADISLIYGLTSYRTFNTVVIMIACASFAVFFALVSFRVLDWFEVHRLHEFAAACSSITLAIPVIYLSCIGIVYLVYIAVINVINSMIGQSGELPIFSYDQIFRCTLPKTTMTNISINYALVSLLMIVTTLCLLYSRHSVRKNTHVPKKKRESILLTHLVVLPILIALFVLYTQIQSVQG